jgi:hypothetical protein
MIDVTFFSKGDDVSLDNASERVGVTSGIPTVLRGARGDVSGRDGRFHSLLRQYFARHPEPGAARCPFPQCRRLLRTDAMEQHYDAAHGGEA